MNKYLIDLAVALMRVSTDNYHWEALNIHNVEYQQEPENNFSSEICRHFRNLMESPNNAQYYHGLRCHFDVRKARVQLQPDIVLHHAPNDQHRQEIYAEVKVTDAALDTDLNRLRRAISDELHFRFAVMIVVNKSIGNTITEIMDFIEENAIPIEDQVKLFLFHTAINEGNLIPDFFFSNFYSLNQ
jgi:hypothetical protein